MPPRFHALRDRAVAAVDRVFAEPVRLVFLRDGLTDASRPPVEVEGILRVGSPHSMNVSGGIAQSWRTRHGAASAELGIDQVTHPGLDIREGDKVRALSRSGQPWFVVVHPGDRSHRRLMLTLGEA